MSRVPADTRWHLPIAESTQSGARGHIALKVVPAVGDPEDRRHVLVASVFHAPESADRVGRSEDARNLARIVVVVDGGAGENPKIGIEFVIGLSGIFQVEAVADRLVADIARKLHALGPVDHDPPGHQFVDGGISDKRVGRCLACHMEVNGIVAELSSLPELLEFDALDLECCKPLPRDHMAAERIL